MIDGVNRLDVFAKFISILARLLGEIEQSLKGAKASSSEWGAVTIASIESGSPIQIKLSGDGRTLRLFLTMLRDAIRLPFLYLTVRGQFLQTLETYAYARKLGVDSPEELGNLERAMVETSRAYAASMTSDVIVYVCGRKADENEVLLLPKPMDHTGAAIRGGLSPPVDSNEANET